MPDNTDDKDNSHRSTYTRGRDGSEWTTAIVPIFTGSCDPRDLVQRLSRFDRTAAAYKHLIDPNGRVSVDTTELLFPTDPSITAHDTCRGICDGVNDDWNRRQFLDADKRTEAVNQYLRKMPGGVDEVTVVLFPTGSDADTVKRTLREVGNTTLHSSAGQGNVNPQVISLDPDYLDLSPQVAPSTEEKDSIAKRATNATGFLFGSMLSGAKEAMTPGHIQRLWREKQGLKHMQEWSRRSGNSEAEPHPDPPVEVKTATKSAETATPHLLVNKDIATSEGREKLRQELDAINAAGEPGWSQTYLNPSNWSIPTSARVRSSARTAASYLDPQGWYDWYWEHGTDDPISNKSRREARSLIQEMVDGHLTWYERYPGKAWASVRSYFENEARAAGSVVYSMKTREPTLSSLASTIEAQGSRMKQNYEDEVAEAKRLQAEAARLQAERQAAAAAAGQVPSGSAHPESKPGPPAA